MIKYKWKCACEIWIETDTMSQMDKANHITSGTLNKVM